MAEAEPFHTATGDLVWDDWDAPPRAPAIPELHLEGFDGPLDMLLDLAERRRIDLGRMSAQAIAEQFVAAMEALARRVPLERRADWLVLATRLLLLRSRLLSPPGAGEADTNERNGASEADRLAAAGFVRAAADWLLGRPQAGIDVFARARAEEARPRGGYVALMEACLVVLEGRPGHPDDAGLFYRPAMPELWRVPDALARIRSMLAEKPGGGGLADFVPPIPRDAPQRPLKARAAVASTFVAGLELSRIGTSEAAQDDAFGAVRLRAANVRGS